MQSTPDAADPVESLVRDEKTRAAEHLLRTSAQAGRTRDVLRLLEASDTEFPKLAIEVDAPDANGSTALLLALTSERPNKATIRALVSHGANPDIANRQGITPRAVGERKRLSEFLTGPLQPLPPL